jgi:NADH dehydrogenase FAD-containing subunit
MLASGARLACDAPLLAIGAQAPAWLAGSGLALDDAGFLAVNACQQSLSHPHVFAAGDVASRLDAPHPRSGVHAVRAGPALLANLRAALQAQPLVPYTPPARTLNLLACGARYAIASWGNWSFEGRWVWHWKDHIDRKFVARYAS